MEGCSAPLVVKFADTQKEKEQKKLQAMQASLWSLTNPVTPTYIASEAALSPATQIQILQQLQAVGLQQQLLQGQNATLLQGTICMYDDPFYFALGPTQMTDSNIRPDRQLYRSY